MKFLKLFLLSIFSGLLLSFAWPVDGFYPIIFIAWIPLLYVESDFSHNGKIKLAFFSHSFFAMLLWNILTTWWIKNASFGGALMAIIANSILMALVLYIFHAVKVKKGEKIGYVALVALWMSFEYIHLRWDITWPWLNLGNVFANQIEIIQWYEYTGVFGGTLWILIVNILLFKILIKKSENEMVRPLLIRFLSILIIPIFISYLIYFNYVEKSNPINIVAVQPNIDPYNEKFSGLSSTEQLIKLLKITHGKLDQKTDFLVCPETALVAYIWEDRTNESKELFMLDSLIKRYPKLNILIGASTLKLFLPGEEVSSTARTIGRGNQFYDSYNTAMQLDHTGQIQLYHKSKLVPGVEKMPWPAVFKYVERFAIDLGGISGSLGMQEEREAFFTPDKKFASGPIVCYESVYGEYVGEYVKKGANFLAIITNDGWWGDTPGYKQHIKYGALRAIETRRSIVRSANTGISATINQKGQIENATSWWKEDAIKATINANEKITFYTRFGDYLGILAMLTTIAIVFSLLIKRTTL